MQAKIQGEAAEGQLRAKVGLEVAPSCGGKGCFKESAMDPTNTVQAIEASSKNILDKEAQIKSAEDKLGRL